MDKAWGSTTYGTAHGSGGGGGGGVGTATWTMTDNHVLAAAAVSVPNSTRSKDMDQKTVQAAPPPTCGGQRRVSPSYLRRGSGE